MPYAQHIPEHIKNQMYTTGQVQKVEDRRPTRPGHQQNYSLFSIPSPSFTSSYACVDGEGAHHHQQPSGTDRELQSRYLHRPTRSTPKAFYASNLDKPLPPLGDTDTDTLRGRDEKMSSVVLRDRADMSQGSWLEDEAYMSSHENSVEDGNPFDLEDYLASPDTSGSHSHESFPLPERELIRPRAPTLSASLTPIVQATEPSLEHRDTVGNILAQPALVPNTSSPFRPTPIQTDSVMNKAGLGRSVSEAEILYDNSPPPFARPPKASTLPDPSNFPDPYPRGMAALHHPPTAMPALSSAGSSSASTRSSAYTNPGSTISANGISGDFSNVRVASGDDVEGIEGGIGLGITSDTIVEMFSRASNGSSLSSGSRKSHVSPMERVRRTDATRTRRSPSQSDDISPMASFDRPPERTLRSQPSYDTSWQREQEDREDFITSEEEFDFNDHHDIDEEEDVEKEEDRTAAIVVAEEGRGLIVRGDGAPLSSLTIQPGITHLLVGKSSTPNHVHGFLNTSLPQICSTLLALDISANFLALLSPALASCTSLEELNISSNPLRALPEFLAELTSLRVLIADSTGISTIPAPLSELQKLHTLSIRRNKMHSLPPWLCTLPCLESLLVDDNPFQGPWKALVEPLLAKAPMTPMYPPSTPMFPQLSASSIATTSETVTDISDADFTDQEDLNGISPPPSVPTSASVLVDRQFTANEDEEHTITPASARLLERAAAATPPAPFGPPQSAPKLARTRTTPSRNYYERNRESRQQSPSKATMTWAGDRTDDPEMSMDPLPAASAMLPPPWQERGELRRMRSADELRKVMQGAAASSQLESPPRPTLPHYAASTIGSKLSDNLDALAQQRKFASLGVNSRGPSRAGSRPPLLNSMWGEQSINENTDADADVESPPRPTRSRPVTPITRRGSGQDGSEASVPQIAALRKLKSSEKEKSGSGRRWGFLKKMSMGKLRAAESSDIPPTPPTSSRPQTTHGGSALSQSISGRARAQTFQASPRKFTPPQLDVSVRAPEAGPSSTPLPSLLMPALHHKPSTDRLRIPSTPQTPSSGGLLAPPSPMSRSAKRRSFLPIDGPPSLNIPIPSTGPFLGSITASNGVEDQDETSRQASPLVQSPEEMHRKEDDRVREASARALRSVMAYLKDMNDLTLLSQGNTMSVYGGTPPMDRVRRPTMGEGTRMQSEASFDTIDTLSSAPTSGSSQMRSIDSMAPSRSGSSGATMSIVTTDSGGSNGEERKSKDDRSKRVMVVREIVETERTYVKSLQELVDIYIRPASLPVNSISSVGSSSKETVVPAAERKVVFGSLESLFLFHKDIFLPALENAATPLFKPDGLAADADSDGRLSSDVAMGVGRMFVSHAAFMKMYSTYINNFENSVQRIRQWTNDRPGTSSSGPSASLTPSSSSAQLANLGLAMSAISAPNSVHDLNVPGKTVVLTSGQRKRIKSYLKRCRLNPRHSQLNLEGYLLLPVQRIPRYRLLLEELGRSTPPPTDSFDDPLDRALNEISSLATNMNEGKRDAESRRKLVQWQARIRGKFPSPLVQPHRRLIMDGKMLLTRIVRKQTMSFEVLNSHGDAASVAVDCLAPELTPRPLYGVLCNDLFVLCRDPSNGQDPNSPVDLWAVLRMQTMPQPTSIVHGNTLRIVDTKAILYLEAPSTSEALTWFRAINMHVPTSSPSA